MQHYDRVLARSPDSFWGHYRAAVVCFQLQRWSEAARHLDCCLKRRSENAALRGQFASCLRQLGLLDDALRECSRALDLAPDYAKFYQSRAFIRVSLGQTEGLEDDLRRFELLSRFLTRGFFRDPPGQGEGNPLPATVPASQRALDLDFNPVFTAQPGDPLVEPEEIQPDELDARANLALTIITKAGTNRFRDEAAETDLTTPGAHASMPDALAIAAAEIEKILTLDPQHITARMQRMMQSLEQGRFQEARNDLDLVLNYPVLIGYLRKDPDVFRFLHRAARRFARYGLIAEALRIADMTVSCSIELKQYPGPVSLLQGNGPQRCRPIGLDPGRSRRQAASTGDPCQRPIQRVVPGRQALRSGPDADQRGARSVAGDQPEKGQQDGSRVSDGRWQMTEGR